MWLRGLLWLLLKTLTATLSNGVYIFQCRGGEAGAAARDEALAEVAELINKNLQGKAGGQNNGFM